MHCLSAAPWLLLAASDRSWSLAARRARGPGRDPERGRAQRHLHRAKRLGARRTSAPELERPRRGRAPQCSGQNQYHPELERPTGWDRTTLRHSRAHHHTATATATAHGTATASSGTATGAAPGSRRPASACSLAHRALRSGTTRPTRPRERCWRRCATLSASLTHTDGRRPSFAPTPPPRAAWPTRGSTSSSPGSTWDGLRAARPALSRE